MSENPTTPQQPSIADRLLARVGNLVTEYEAKVVQLEDLNGQYREYVGRLQAENETLRSENETLRADAVGGEQDVLEDVAPPSTDED